MRKPVTGPGPVRRFRTAWIAILTAALTIPGAVRAEEARDESKEEKKLWSNSTELSLVVSEGNSNTQSVGFRNNLKRTTDPDQFNLKLNATLSYTADDPYRQIVPGITWEPGEVPSDQTSTLIDPPTEPDVDKLFAEGRYDHKISQQFTWNAGLSWDRNQDAGILSRTILFSGLGNIWKNADDHKFRTSYSLSFTDREEENPDPQKEDKFAGLRLNLYYLKEWFKTTTFDLDWTANLNFADSNDWSADLYQGFAVNIKKGFALKISLQWLYNNEPALEDIDLIAQVELIDPDGIPGSGDEYFITVSDGGAVIELGEVQERKKSLDTVLNTSLVIKF